MRRFLASTAVLVLAFSMTGCQKLFTTSLAEKLARTSVTVPTTISNADAADLLASTNDPVVIAALLSTLGTQANASGATNDTKALAAEAALASSGVATSVTAPLLALASNTSSPDPTAVASIVTSLRSGAEVANVLTNLERLSDPAVLAASDMSSSDLVMAALVLAASALPASASNPMSLSGTALTDYQNSSDVKTALSILEYASTLSGGDNSLLSSFSSMLPTGTP